MIIYRFLQSRWVSLIMLGLLCGVGLALYRLRPSLNVVWREDRALNDLRNRTNSLPAVGETILEREAKTRLNYKLPDENVVFVYEKTAEIVPPPTQIEANWHKWWRLYIVGSAPKP